MVRRLPGGLLAIYEPEDEEMDLAEAPTPSPLGTYFPEADWADDLVHLLSKWGDDGEDADENADGAVDAEDLLELLEDW